MLRQKVTIWSLEEDEALANVLKNKQPIPVLLGRDIKAKLMWKEVAAALKLRNKAGKECAQRFRVLHSKYILHYRNGTLKNFPQASAFSFLKKSIKSVRRASSSSPPRHRTSPTKTEGQDEVKIRMEMNSDFSPPPPAALPLPTPSSPRGRPKKHVGRRSSLVKFSFRTPKMKNATSMDVKPASPNTASTNSIPMEDESDSYPPQLTEAVSLSTSINGNSLPKNNPHSPNLGRKRGRPKVVKTEPVFTPTEPSKTATSSSSINGNSLPKNNPHSTNLVKKRGRPKVVKTEPVFTPTQPSKTASSSTNINGNSSQQSCSSEKKRGRPKVVKPVPLFTATCVPPPPPRSATTNNVEEGTTGQRPIPGHLRGPNFLFSQYVASILDTLPDEDALIARNKVHEMLHEAQSKYLSGRPDKMNYLNNHTGELFEIECGNCLKVNLVQGNHHAGQ